MKIAYLVAEFPKPSETFVSREVQTLQRLGLPVEVFALKGPESKELTKLDPRTRHLASKVHYLSYKEAAGAFPDRWRAFLAAYRENRRIQAECTIKTNPHSRLMRAMALARRCKERGITHLHAHWPCATQIACIVHQLTGLPFSISVHAHEVEHDYGHFPAAFETLRFATFCNQAAMERLLSRLEPAARQKAHLVYHGVDVSGFRALPFPETPGPLRVISAGRLTRTKGFDRLIRGCALYQKGGGQVNLTILGEGSLEGDLRQLARECDFEQSLDLPGWLPHDQVAARMASAHVFALLADTNFHDGLPNVLLEAMACARPAIISPLPASSEAISNGVEGYVLNAADDLEGFAGALQLCNGRRAELSAMGQAARARVMRTFDQDMHARSLLDLFERTAFLAHALNGSHP
jgi:glycosyltransferase involved in cell wall biosynthesis